MKRIAFDIDGCINNFQEVLVPIIKRDYGVDVPLDDHDMLRHIGLTEYDQWRAFWNKYNPEINRTIKVEKNADVVLSTLRKIGYEVFIITARDYSEWFMTTEFLKAVEYDELIMNGQTKYHACQWKGIDIMVEDNPNNAMALAEAGIKVLLVVRPYNRTIKHPNIIDVNSWDEIYEKIIEFTTEV